MEALIARVAVYNWIDAKSLFFSVLLNLKVLLKTTNGFIFVSTIFLIISVTVYSLRKVRSSESKCQTGILNSEECSKYESSDIENLRQLYKSCNFTASGLCNIWLQEINDCINNSLKETHIQFTPVSEYTLSDVKISDFEVYHEDLSSWLTLYFFVSIPMLCLHGNLTMNQTESLQEVTLSLRNYNMKMCCKLKVDDLVLLELKMYATSSPQFDLLIDTVLPLSPSQFKQLLIDIISKLIVSWSPVDRLHRSPNHTMGSIQMKDHPTDEDRNVLLHRELESCIDSSDSVHNGIDTSVKPQLCESDFKNVSHCESQEHIETKSVIPEERSSKSLVQKDKSFMPVVLAHNARLRQSLVARHAPRPFVCKMVRSASCYGEEGVSNLLQDQELGNFESEDVPNGDFHDLRSNKMEPTIQIQTETTSTPPNKSEVINKEVVKRKDIENQVTQGVDDKDALQELRHLVPVRKPNTKVDVSPLRERLINNFSSKKLLVKVVKAEELSVKSVSGAYCVVELDEPYQRHSTHCSMSGQLFWDQHLLFDLNNNSKRIALEIFELGKRKKSYSRGRAELLLTHLLTNPNSDGDLETNSVNISDTIRRQILLIDRSSSLHEGTSMSSVVAPPSVQSVSERNNLSTTNQVLSNNTNAIGQPFVHSIPSITAEFNFMEKATEDFRSRASPNSPQMRFPLRISQPNNVHNANQDYHSADHSGSFSHSSSLEFSNIKSTSLAHNKSTTEYLMQSVVENVQTDSEEETDNLSTSKDSDVVRRSSKDIANEIKSIAAIKTGNLSSPISSRRAHCELHTIRSVDEDQPSTPSSPLIYDTTKMSETSSDGHISSCDLNEHFKECTSPNEQNMYQETSETEGHVKSLISTLVDPTSSSGSKIDSKQSESFCKRSALLGPATNNLSNNLELASNLQRVDSPVSLDGPSVTARPHSLASRLKPTRILHSSVLRSGKRSTIDEPTRSCSNVSSLALLGPSRQLAGVVAGLSSLASDSATAPTAAALASAIAVVGATGNWQPQLSVDSESAQLSGSTVLSDLLSRRDSKLEASDDSLIVPPYSNVSSFGPPEHFVPPPTYVAADSPGTFTALSHPWRSDASNLRLFRIFRHKKKRFRSVGAEKLVYWETNNLDDLDAISTEGYQRILQDDYEASDVDQSENK
ncbi:C2 calcium lipid binding region protein [Schistosoma japonicum]|nr:C2 calcium lipid binding region protein [Schistosoma japonicum]